MLDCQLFGLNPAGHHLVNVLLHATTALLLFSVLNAITGAMWRSAFVATIFAIHPLRAESVAWVAERKDVLSGVFFMLTLVAYVRYARDPRLGRYLVTGLFFGLALMCKPTVVMLPVLLLLLDYWPLGRMSPARQSGSDEEARPLSSIRWRIFLEKIPLLFLSVVAAVLTLVAQRQTVGYSQSVPLAGRLSNALVSYVAYVAQTFWPSKLAVFYPNAGDRVSLITVSSAALLLGGITVLVVRLRRYRPYLLVGWSWYLICLLPVIGIVQVGLQGRADRYTYLPQIGLCLALVWSVAALPIARSRFWQIGIAAGAIVIVAVLAWGAAVQTSFWKDTESLWNHALAVTENNDVAHTNMAALLMKRGRVDDAIAQYNLALRGGTRAESHNHLSPAIVENSLGNALAQKSDLDAAIIHYRKALELRPDFSDARSNLSAMLFRKGDIPAAILEYQKVVATPPEDAACHQRLATMLVKTNRSREALAHYRRAFELAPDSLDAINALAWMLATSSDPAVRNSAEALHLAVRANQQTSGKDPVVLRILAASYTASGRSAEGVTTAERALTFTHDAALISALNSEIKLYRATAPQIVLSGVE
jgi:tetratricopeptide (TPR) repeat protein